MLLSTWVAKAAAVGYMCVMLAVSGEPPVKNCQSFDGVSCPVDDPETCARQLNTAIRCEGLWDGELISDAEPKRGLIRRALDGPCKVAGYVCVGSQSILCVRKCRTDWVWVRRCSGLGENFSCHSELVPVVVCWFEQSGVAQSCLYGETPCQNGHCISKDRACDTSDAFLKALQVMTWDEVRSLLASNGDNGTLSFLEEDLGQGPVVALPYAGQRAFLSLDPNPNSVRTIASNIAEYYGTLWSELSRIGASAPFVNGLNKFKTKVKEISRRYYMLMFVPVCKNDSPNSDECYLNCKILEEILRDFLNKCQAFGIERCDPSAFVLDCNSDCTRFQVPGTNLNNMNAKFAISLAAPDAMDEEYFQ